MTKKELKKEKIQRIISGEVDYNSPAIDRSPLATINKRDIPKTSSFYLQVFGGVLLVGGSLSFYLWSPNWPEVLEYAAWLTFAGIMSGGILLGAAIAAYLRNISTLRLLAERPLEELQQLENYLARYLENMSQRTSRYFHCVTNSKVTNYFVLSQMREALAKKIQEINANLDKNSQPSLCKALELLKGSLIFTDGATASSGYLHVLPLARLSATIPLLIENLENGLAELETEINRAKAEASLDSPNRR